MSTLIASTLPSERRFGVSFAVILAAGGIYGFLQAWHVSIYGVCILASVTLAVISITAPRLLGPLNRAWFRLGLLLGKIVNPVVLGFIFYGLLTPVAMVTRLFGRDELRLRRPAVSSYWLTREAPRASPESFTQQF